MAESLTMAQLMEDSGVGFGTSGARGQVTAMTDRVCYAYALAFVQDQLETGTLACGGDLGLAGDHRPSTPRIIAACSRAILDAGCRPRVFGSIPTPALTAYGIAHRMPTLMVTGSHIPDDRNGIKFNLPTGEILKQDEARIRARLLQLPEDLFDAAGAFIETREGSPVPGLPPVEQAAAEAYVARFLAFFPADALAGLRVGLYEHSSVARDLLFEILSGLGAQVTRLGRSDHFIPVDTEAIRDEDVALARDWIAEGRFDALVSTDGDGDRPLIGDEQGRWLRGDVAGVLCARTLGMRALATPVSSNSLVERCGAFDRIARTRIGSPYVISGMQALSAQGFGPVGGYEANGGFLTQDDLDWNGCCLPALPTRDAAIVILALLFAVRDSGKRMSELVETLPARFTHSDRLRDFPSEISAARLAAFDTGDEEADRAAIEAVFGEAFGPLATIDRTDGLRLAFRSGEIAHLRPSGNAPELRAYTEADSPERAQAINRICLEILEAWREA